MEGVRSPIQQIQDCFKKTFFLICCQYIVSDMGVTDQMHCYLETKTETLRLQECFLIIDPFGSCFATNIYETGTVTSGLCYIEDLIFLEK